MNVLMFQMSNSDLIQENHIRSPNNLQGKNLQSLFSFFENKCFYFYMLYLVGFALK